MMTSEHDFPLTWEKGSVECYIFIVPGKIQISSFCYNQTTFKQYPQLQQ